MNLPNKISLFRIVLIPVVVIVWVLPYSQLGIDMPVYYLNGVSISLKNLISVVIFAVASFSDFLDGYLARLNNQVTSFGKFIDPIADKCLTTTMFILFAAEGIISPIPVLVMVWRDIIVDGIRMIAATREVVVSAGIYGKLKTVLQMFTIIFILLNNFPFQLWNLPVCDVLLWLSMFMSVISGVVYYKQTKSFIWESK